VATCVREQTEVPLRAGDTLVTFTDGLVERRDEGIDAGLERLRHAVGAMDGLPLVAGVNGLVRSLRDERFDDDITVLGLRRQG
jgi:serine phosphatase RsbU (regulator of sigma subunit)